MNPKNINNIYFNIISFILLFLAIVYSYFLHLPSISGLFLSDTYSHLRGCYNAQNNGVFWSTMLAYFSQGIAGSSTDMYRPLGMISMCSDYVLFDGSPFILKSIQFFYHILNTVLLFVFIRYIFDENRNKYLMASLASIIFLFNPTSPEISMWIGTRFDSLVNLFMLLSCMYYWRMKRTPALVFLCLALLTKESAVVIPVMLFTMSWFRLEFKISNFRTNLFTALKESWLFFLVLIFYFILRMILFGDSFQVYDSEISIVDKFFNNLAKFPQVFSQLALGAWQSTALIKWFWFTVFISLSFSGWIAYKNNAIKIWLIFFVWILITVIALISQIGAMDKGGTGSRVLYNVSMWWSIIIAMPILYLKGSYRYLLFLYIIPVIYIQSFSIQQWTSASVVSKALNKSIHHVASSFTNNDEWALVLIPENIGVALLGRNAQGSFVLPPFQPTRYLDNMVPTISADLEIWRNRIISDFVHEFKLNSENPKQYPSKYYCTQKNGTIIEIEIDNNDLNNKISWEENWNNEIEAKNCL